MGPELLPLEADGGGRSTLDTVSARSLQPLLPGGVRPPPRDKERALGGALQGSSSASLGWGGRQAEEPSAAAVGYACWAGRSRAGPVSTGDG